jgi:hypothetical protein
VRPDIVASYRITVDNRREFDPHYLVEDFALIKGVRGVAIVDLPQQNEFALDVRFHGQTEQQLAESISQRIFGLLRRDSNLSAIDFAGLLGHEEPEPGLAWTGRDPFDEITSRHDDMAGRGQPWVRADYFVHALSFEDLGIRDVNLEHMLIEALQRWPQRVQARESVRRLREMYALLEQVREFANMPVPEVDSAVRVEEPEPITVPK